MARITSTLRATTALVAFTVTFSIVLATVSTAATYTIRGRVQYQDGDPQVSMPGGSPTFCTSVGCDLPAYRDAAWVDVRIVQNGRVRGRGETDSTGLFDIAVDTDNLAPMSIDLEVNNRFVRVMADMECENERLRRRARIFTPTGAAEQDLGNVRVDASYQTITVGECAWSSYDADVSMAGALNVNEVVTKSWSDAMDNRDPRARDGIGRVDVEYCDEDWSHYDSYWGEIFLTCHHSSEQGVRLDHGFYDEAIAHEFGHHLQAAISTEDWGSSGTHFLCREIDTWDANDPELAWQEGFADYFAAHMLDANPSFARRFVTAVDAMGSLVSWNYRFNAEIACRNVDDADKFVDPDDDEKWIAVEGHITAVLYDLADGLGQGLDSWDLVDGPAIGGHRRIMEIFDHELDCCFDAADFVDFYEAWVGRTDPLSLVDGQAALDMIANQVGIVPIETSLAPDRKNRAFGFVEPNPLPTTGVDSSSYVPSRNETTLQSRSSFIDGTAPGVPQIMRIGVSNVTRGNTPVDTGLALAGNADATHVSVAAIRFTPPTDPAWLTPVIVAQPHAPLYEGQLGYLGLVPGRRTIENLQRGTHVAEVDLEFTHDLVPGATAVETRTVRWEIEVLDTEHEDTDHDGLTNGEEMALGLSCPDPRNRDSDDDGLSDGAEVNDYGTDPCDEDTDGDSSPDGVEVSASCFRPLTPDTAALPVADADLDGLSNEEEWAIGSDPCNSDSDGDGVPDDEDVCPSEPDPLQMDTDGDGAGDECETDDDGDGIHDWIDEDPLDPDVGFVLPIEELIRFERPGRFEAAPRLPDAFCDPRICKAPAYLLREARPIELGQCDGGVCPAHRLRLVDSDMRYMGNLKPSDYGLDDESGFATVVELLPDLNSDGRYEIAIGAPFARLGGDGVVAGLVLLLSGKDFDEIQRLSGPAPGMQFGAALTLLGDGRLAIGAPGSLSRSGEVHVVDLEDTSSRVVLSGLEPGDGFGSVVMDLGDFRGEGEASLLIGAPGVRGGPVPGAVHLADPAGTRPTTLLREGDDVGDTFGWAMAAGDVNHDGRLEIMVGAPDADGGAGSVTLLSDTGEVLYTLSGLSPGDRLGASMVALPESPLDPVMGEPLPALGFVSSFLAGMPGAWFGKLHSGGAVILDVSGAIGAIGGVQGYEKLGSSVALGPDPDGDGFGAFVLGAVDANGMPESLFVERSNPTLACQDGWDNDNDGGVDWNGGGNGSADAQCAWRPWQDDEAACGLGFEGGLAAALWAVLRRRRRAAQS